MNLHASKKDFINELVEYFISQEFNVISARDITGYNIPPLLKNDGFGDQLNRSPDVLAYDPENNCYVIGIVRMNNNELDTEDALTEYNVFLDQFDTKTGQPYRLYILVPEECINNLTSIITHYIHREYWNRVIIVSSKIKISPEC